ncbi:MAG: hypothetical protein GEU98_05805 [Pseudonocardiaceae bacterium]|nr:hypothetical protein [Pseudonocardiaceae bacterium]
MKRKIRAAVAVVATALALTGVNLVTASPAHAAASCSAEQRNSVPTPGFDTDFSVKVCVDGAGSDTKRAYIIVGWTDGGDSSTDGDRKFDKLRIHQKLERNNTAYDSNSCSIAGKVNRNSSGAESCSSVTYTSSARGGWTGGYLEYDIDRDGKGSFTWSLHGSPVIS